jgi:hypothetical protein
MNKTDDRKKEVSRIPYEPDPDLWVDLRIRRKTY